MMTYLLVWVHGSEATRVTSLTAFGRNGLNLLRGAVGKVAGVGIGGHGEELSVVAELR